MAETNLVKASSEAYGYDYASLSDIVKQGQTLPKMRLIVIEGNDYIEYFDGENWNVGARIVVPEMKGSNAAQAYGAALTYARRYTAFMALQLASDDDKTVETKKPAEKAKTGKFNLKDADEQIKNAKTADEVRRIYASVPEKLRQYVEKACKNRIEELK